jgi:hypothetical protein
MDSTYDNGDMNANSESSNQMVQPNSFDPQKFEERILKLVDEKVSDPRLTQSIKDKGLAEMKKSKDFREIFREIQTMKESGMTDREIELEARIREVEERESRIPSNNPGRAVEGNNTDVAKLFAKTLGLDLNDSDVLQSFSSNNMEEQLTTLKNLADRRNKTISPAIMAQPAGDGAKSQDLLSEYQKRASSVRGDDLIELKIEYRKKGLDIN